MSLVPVTSHPRFSAAVANFEAALPLLNPSTRFPTSIPTEANLRAAVDELQVGMAELRPMTSPTDAWLHQSARVAIAQAEQAIELLRGPVQAVVAGTVDPKVGSADTATAVRQARETIARAVAAATL